MRWTMSIAAGLSLGAAATVGVTLAAEQSAAPKQNAPAPVVSAPAGSAPVQYGDRCGTGAACPNGGVRTDDRSGGP